MDDGPDDYSDDFEEDDINVDHVEDLRARRVRWAPIMDRNPDLPQRVRHH